MTKWKKFLSSTGGSLSFYSSLVNKSPGTSSLFASFPSSPHSRSEEDSGTTARDSQKLALTLKGLLSVAPPPKIISNVGNHNGPAKSNEFPQPIHTDGIIRETYSFSWLARARARRCGLANIGNRYVKVLPLVMRRACTKLSTIELDGSSMAHFYRVPKWL